MRLCDCGQDPGNLGLSNCKDLFKSIKKIVLIPTYDSDGNRNKIAAADVLDASYFTDLINEEDTTKRWYISPDLENVVTERGDNKTEEMTGGKIIYLEEGTRTFVAVITGAPAELKKKLDLWSCNEMSYYIIDKEGSIIGSYDGVDLYPIQVENDTFSAKFMMPTPEGSQKIEVSFNVSELENDGDLKKITKTESGTDPLRFRGLIDLNMVLTSVTTTSLIATLTLDYGTFKTPQGGTGFVADDFVSSDSDTVANIYNDTVSSDVPVTASEGAGGAYTLTYAPQTLADELIVKFKKTGYNIVQETGVVA